jgi:hypothetical protein
MVGPGVGGGFDILLRSTWISPSFAFGYSVPIITSISPAVPPPRGGLMTVLGRHFGTWMCASGAFNVSVVTIRPGATASFDTAGMGGYQDAPTYTLQCAVMTWNTTAIQCTLPASSALPLYIDVQVAGQRAQQPLAHDVPTIAGIADDTLSPTAGNWQVTVRGSGFGDPSWPVAVLVANASVTVVSHTDTAVVFLSPPGCGMHIPARVITPVGQSAAVPMMSYAPPSIDAVTTTGGRGCEGGFTLVMTGTVRAYVCACLKGLGAVG